MTIAAVSPLEVSHPEGWTWQPETRRYRDPSTGRFASNATVKGWRDTFLDRRQQAVRDLASALSSGWLTSGSWREQIGEIQRETYGIMAALGRGGLAAMELEDWNRVNEQLARQQPFLERFTNEIEAGGLSEDQIGARSELYVGTAVQAFEAGRAAAWGDPELPELPGDGNTECGGNCRCHWDITPTETGWECTWTGSNDERTCMGCATNQDTWDPLLILYPEPISDSVVYGPPPERESEFIIDRVAGMSFKALGKKYGISDTTAMHWSRQLNISPGKPPPVTPPPVTPIITPPPPVVIPPTPPPPVLPPVARTIPRGLPPDRVDEFVNDRKAGLSFKALGRKYGVSDSTAMHWSRLLGIDVAPGGKSATTVPVVKPELTPAGPQSVIWNVKNRNFRSSRNYNWYGVPRFELQYRKGWVLIDNKSGTSESFKTQLQAMHRADAIAKLDPGPPAVEIKPGVTVQVTTAAHHAGQRGTVIDVEVVPAGTTTSGIKSTTEVTNVYVRMVNGWAAGRIIPFQREELIGIPPPEPTPTEVKVTVEEAKQQIRAVQEEHQHALETAAHESGRMQAAEWDAQRAWHRLAANPGWDLEPETKRAVFAAEENYAQAVQARQDAWKKYLKLQNSLLDEIREKVLFHKEPAQITVRAEATWDKEIRTEIDTQVDAFKRLVGRGRLDGLEVTFRKADDRRAYYQNDAVHIGSSIRSGKTIVHELGHWLEDRNSVAAAMVQGNYDSRTIGEDSRPLSELVPGVNYGPMERSRPDKFRDPYMGKVYWTPRSHELLSMGIEFLYGDPIGLIRDDPETFRIVWEILHSGGHVVPSAGMAVEKTK